MNRLESDARPRRIDTQRAQDRSCAVFSKKEMKVFEEMLSYYRAVRVGIGQVNRKSVEREISALWDFVAYCGAPPWRIDEADLASWGKHLFDDYGHTRAVQKESRRAVRDFLQIISGTRKYAVVVPQEFGGRRVVQLVHPWNSQTYGGHASERKEQPCLDRDDIACLLNTYRDAIAWAESTRSKDLHPLERDYAIVYTIYVLGLRASEAVGLNVDGWFWNECRSEFGPWGYTIVTGKFGKQRAVFTTHPSLVSVLQWYEAQVRPCFLLNSAPGERAMFLSERGERLGYDDLRKRFAAMLVQAGLQGRGFHLHSLRHASITHEQYSFTAEFVQRKSGHDWLGTTANYTHFNEEFLRREFLRVTGLALDRAQGSGMAE